MRWRYSVILAMIVLPVVAVLVAGGWLLWETGRLRWLFWLLPICWSVAYFLGRRSKGRVVPVSDAALDSPRHWTAQDETAMKLVVAKQQVVADIPPGQLGEPQFYLDTAIDLAQEIAQHYHPKTKDPIGSVTVVEILAVAELAIEESAQWVNRYVPGSHLLTVDHWRMLSKAPKWLRAASNVTWVSSLLLNPANAVRYVTSKLAASSATRQLQENVLASFYVAFVRFAGFYLIEMNSGRLRGGAERYRELRSKLARDRTADDSKQRGGAAGRSQPDEMVEVTITLVGQVNAGKSSLVNALLGEHVAAMDVLPKTRTTHRFSFELADSTDRLVLLDTPGYGEDGASQAQREEIQIAIAKSDLVLMVMDASNPARKSDVAVMSELKDWSIAQPQLKMPSVLGVLTHIDHLRPVMEWSPPYDWQHPSKSKERAIREAVDYNRVHLGQLCQAVIPVCTDVTTDRVYGIQQWLLPAMTAVLEEARACSLIRSLQDEASRGQVKKTFGQLYKAGLAVLKASVLEPTPNSRAR